MNNHTNRLPDLLQEFIHTCKWTFAKTMPKWPHEYIVRKNVDEDLFFQLVKYIQYHGYEGKFYKKHIIYCDISGMVYWTMGAPIKETSIINRCKKENSFEYRLKHGSLP